MFNIVISLRFYYFFFWWGGCALYSRLSIVIPIIAFISAKGLNPKEKRLKKDSPPFILENGFLTSYLDQYI